MRNPLALWAFVLFADLRSITIRNSLAILRQPSIRRPSVLLIDGWRGIENFGDYKHYLMCAALLLYLSAKKLPSETFKWRLVLLRFLFEKVVCGSLLAVV